MKFYILSRKWTKREEQVLTWWGPNHKGYVYNIEKAGLYDEETAKIICKNGCAVAVSEDEMKELASKMVYKSDKAISLLYAEHPEYNYREESKPLPKHCDNCGVEQ